jgi:restriction system protein
MISTDGNKCWNAGAVLQQANANAVSRAVCWHTVKGRKMTLNQFIRAVKRIMRAYQKMEREFRVIKTDKHETGEDYEHWVAEQLRRKGWSAKVTPARGDKGIDVIAKKNGKTVGIQCKRYSSNVGNSPVQEILAAQAYYDLDTLAVVTTVGFTPAAKELASRTGVKLLLDSQLYRLSIPI